VNFYSESQAEKAARAMNGYLIRNISIKTKGPSALAKENHSPSSPLIDHRPYTDCSFGIACKKGPKVSQVINTCLYMLSLSLGTAV